MPIESASYINQLNPDYPQDVDMKMEGAAQIRLTKLVNKNSFPNVGGPVTASHIALSQVGVTQPPTDSSTKPASTAYVQQALTNAALSGQIPGLVGNSKKLLGVSTDETYVEWVGRPSVVRVSKSAAYTITAADTGNLIDCTGTWTLGFDAVATLGATFACYVRNYGTGTITADPNAAETIDGMTSGTIPSGMTLLIICDGTALYCVRVGPRVAVSVLTSGTSGTIPLGVRNIRARVQGAGGRGMSGAMCGAYSEAFINVTPGASYTYAIGAAATTTGPGGDTTLTMGGRTITCKGGTQSQSSFVTATGGDINISGSVSNTWPVASPLGAGGSSSTSAAGYGGASSDVNSGAGVIVLEY